MIDIAHQGHCQQLGLLVTINEFTYVIKTIHIRILKLVLPSWSTALYMAVYAVSIENKLASQIDLI